MPLVMLLHGPPVEHSGHGNQLNITRHWANIWTVWMIPNEWVIQLSRNWATFPLWKCDLMGLYIITMHCCMLHLTCSPFSGSWNILSIHSRTNRFMQSDYQPLHYPPSQNVSKDTVPSHPSSHHLKSYGQIAQDWNRHMYTYIIYII